MSSNSGSTPQPPLVDRAADGAIRIAVCVSAAALPLFYTARVHDLFLAKSGLALILGGLLGSTWLVRAAVKGSVDLVPVSFAGPILLFLASSGASLVLAAGSVAMARGGEVLLGQMFGFVFFAVVATSFRNAAAAIRLIRVIAAVGLVVAAVGLLENNGLHLIAANARNPFPIATLGNPNFVAHYLDLVIPVTVSLLFLPGRRRGWVTILASCALAATAVHMVLTQSRGGWVSVGLVALLWAAVRLRSLRWARFIPVALLVAALLTPIAELLFAGIRVDGDKTLYDSVTDQLERSWERAATTLDESDPSRSMRILLWRNTSSLIAAHPLFGVGPGNYETQVPAYRSVPEHRAWQELTGRAEHAAYFAHNEYLEYWAESGIVGLAAMVWLFTVILVRGWRCLHGRRGYADARVPVIVAGCTCALAAALIHALFSFNLQDAVSGTLFWMIAGIVVGVTDGDRPRLALSVAGRAKRWTVASCGAGLAVLGLSAGLRILVADSYYLQARTRYNEIGHLQDPGQIRGAALEAFEAMRRATAWRDADFSHHHMLGVFAFNMRRYEEAEAALRRSIELHPNNDRALRLLGKTLLTSGDGAAAVAPLRRLVELDPLDYVNYDLLATAYRHAGDSRRALEARRQALAFRPLDTDLMLRLADEYRLAGDAESSAAILERAAGLLPGDGLVQGTLGSVYLVLGQLEDAERVLRIAVAADPERAEWRHNLVQGLIRQRRTAAARRELATALELFPDDAGLVALSKKLGPSGE